MSLESISQPPEFKAFPKISRLFREIAITEKIDGTNACVVIQQDVGLGAWAVWAQSRKRLINSREDNHGFAKWVEANREDLIELGPGYHYGEWWGQGIQRGYGLDEKRFSLFGHWYHDQPLPGCVQVAPILYRGEFSTGAVAGALNELALDGSAAAPGFDNPEGVVVYHEHSRTRFKVTLDDDAHKEQA